MLCIVQSGIEIERAALPVNRPMDQTQDQASFLLVVTNTRAGNHPITSSQCRDATQARKAIGASVSHQIATPIEMRQGTQGVVQHEHLNSKA